ncbi:MAG TPA: TfoX/Sxy family protein [Anaerolineales bacterium]|nr:TfoX/Sxy family protein [Anaerolineales bacterium]
MAYDERLAARIRTLLVRRRGITEKEQFGGVGFLFRGNMACGVIGNDLLVRIGPEGYASALKGQHVRPFAITGKPARGWALVAPAGLRTPASLKKWVERGLEFARTLPAK